MMKEDTSLASAEWFMWILGSSTLTLKFATDITKMQGGERQYSVAPLAKALILINLLNMAMCSPDPVGK